MLSSTSREFYLFLAFPLSDTVFSPVIFETYIGLDRQLSLILGGVNSTVYALSAFASYGMIEHLGRRKMFLYGTAGQAISMVCNLIPFSGLVLIVFCSSCPHSA